MNFKPVEHLDADELTNEIRDMDCLLRGVDPDDLRPEALQRNLELRMELGRRLEAYDLGRMDINDKYIQSFSHSLGTTIFFLARAHKIRELTKEEADRLNILLFNFFKEIR